MQQAGEASPPTTPGVLHVTGIAGQSFVLNAVGSNFGSMFVNLQAVSRTPRRRRSVERWRSCQQLVGRVQQDHRRASCRSFRRRRCAAWAGPAASRSWSKTAATSGLETLQAQTENLVTCGQGRTAAGRPADLFGLFGQRAACSSRARPAGVHEQGRQPAATSPTRCRSTRARSTSTTSTCSAAPGR